MAVCSHFKFFSLGNQSHFSELKAWTLIPVEEDEKMLYEVNPTSFWLLALIDVFRYLGPSNLLFSLLISTCGSQPFTAQPDLLRLVSLKAVRGMKI